MFAQHFERTCTAFNSSRCDALKNAYSDVRKDYVGSPICVPFDSELIDKLLCKIKKGKAAGIDELSAEHLQYAHPIVIVILCKLFNLFVLTGHVPPDFGKSYTVPIPKCDSSGRSMTVDDFRAIAISPVISKLFELAILERYEHFFVSSDHQFGFKKGLGCRDAIFCVKCVIEHFVENGTTVNLCSIDLSKAFDKMSRYALLIKLAQKKLPNTILDIIEGWFSVSETSVKWENHFSRSFKLSAGVRQGGVLSPALFSIFIDSLVDKVVRSGVGCHIFCICVAIFLYADDIVLLSPTVNGLQALLDICEDELLSLDMQINIKKSTCVRIGQRFNERCVSLCLKSGGYIQWSDHFKYLGIHFVCGRTLRCSFEQSKMKFYRSFNAI